MRARALLRASDPEWETVLQTFVDSGCASDSVVVVARRVGVAGRVLGPDGQPLDGAELELFHIFRYPRSSASMRDSIHAKARLILDSIRAGGDFADFARRYSEDQATAASGGDLGFWKRGEFVPDFEEIVFSLKDGQISDIVETSRGFHIIQLLERRGEKVNARHILFRAASDASSMSEARICRP